MRKEHEIALATLALLAFAIFLCFIAAIAHADQVISSDIVSHSTAWYSSTGNKTGLGNGLTATNPSITVAISEPSERGSPYSQTEVIDCYSDSGYTSTTACDGAGGPSHVTATASVTANYTKQFPTFNFTVTIVPAVYVAFSVGSDGADVYGVCSGTALNGTYAQSLCAGGAQIGTPYYTGIGAPPPPPNQTTRIISVMPYNGASTSSPVTLGMTYYSASTSIADTVSIDLYDSTLGADYVYSTTTSATRDALTTWTPTSIGLITGHTYMMTSMLGQSQPGTTFLYSVVSTTTSFAVGTSVAPWNVSTINASNTSVLATSTCDVFNITGCFQNALSWAFAPSQASMTALSQSGTRISSVAPMGYIVLIRNALKSATSTATSSLASIIESGAWWQFFFAPLRLLLGMLLWVAALVGFYLYWRHKTI